MARTAAAIFVITQEDIRRSGATNIPDLLRMVPGMDVAQIDANTWAISARGFNARFGNELFVMVDGRSVYTPSFGGVFWDTLDIPLEDIERIEVIRGPGGSIWGTNAVNGVINIITKKTSDTKGALVTAGRRKSRPRIWDRPVRRHSGQEYRLSRVREVLRSGPSARPDRRRRRGRLARSAGRFSHRHHHLVKRHVDLPGRHLFHSRRKSHVRSTRRLPRPRTVPFEMLVNITGGFVQGSLGPHLLSHLRHHAAGLL